MHVDIRSELKGISLERLSMDSLPEGSKVDQLASELQGLKAAGHCKPFVYVDIKKHIPRWAATDSPAASEGNHTGLLHYLLFSCFRLLQEIESRRSHARSPKNWQSL